MFVNKSVAKVGVIGFRQSHAGRRHKIYLMNVSMFNIKRVKRMSD